LLPLVIVIAAAVLKTAVTLMDSRFGSPARLGMTPVPNLPQRISGSGVDDAALHHGYLITVVNTDDNLDRERQSFSILRAHQMDGLLVIVSSGTAMRNISGMLCGPEFP
jgi:hypothetical protein